MTHYLYRSFLTLLLMTCAFEVLAQRPGEETTPIPKEVRGYKIHRARVEMKRTNEPGKKPDKKSKEKSEQDE